MGPRVIVIGAVGAMCIEATSGALGTPVRK